MATPPDRGESAWLRTVRGAQVPAVLAGGEEPLDDADLARIRSTLRGGTYGAVAATAALAGLLLTGLGIDGRVALAVGTAHACVFLAGYAVQVRSVTRCYRVLPRGVPPVALAAASLPAGVALGALSALAVAAPYGTVLTLLLLGVGAGATVLATGVALGVACGRAAVRQTRPAEDRTDERSPP